MISRRWTVDGMDVVAVEAAARSAIVQIRKTGKPVFLECKTYRFRAHSMFDAQLYRRKDRSRGLAPARSDGKVPELAARQQPDP